jgi:hypothetical protein
MIPILVEQLNERRPRMKMNQIITGITALAVFFTPVVGEAQSNPLGSAKMNPDVSAIVDMFYTNDDTKEGIGHVKEEISGFTETPGMVEEGDHAHGTEEGFNLRHLELQFSAAVDPYFKGSAIAAIDLEGAELETAEVETTSLPWGLTVKGGKFYSNFGYVNSKHGHQWDFTDQTLVYELLLGEHGLNDKGLQLSWLAPTPFYMLLGAESFQGNNEKMFAYHGDGFLPRHETPRVGTGWLKVSPNLPGAHALQVGLFASKGVHQEELSLDDSDPEADQWRDGYNAFHGADLIYKYNSPKSYGQSDFFLQGEYLKRKKNMEIVYDAIDGTRVGTHRVDVQDGYYAQTGYGFLPRWRAAARWEEAGLTNKTDLPDGSSLGNESSRKFSGMVDFTPTEFSRLRLQYNNGSYATDEGRLHGSEIFFQWMVSIGAHGAHSF